MAGSRPRSRPLLHPDEAIMQRALERALARGTSEHYADPEQYDHEYRRRRDDVAFYVALATRHRGPILELGCGTGRLTLPLLRAGHEVVGVDGSASMLARARTRIADAGLTAELHRADFRALTAGRLGRRRFPLVVCPFNAFQHLYDRQDVERFLAGVRAHLAPGGRFVFDVMNPDLAWLSRDPHRRWARTRYRDPRTGRWMTYSHQLVYDAPLQIAFMTIFYSPVAEGRQARGAEARETRRHLTHRHFFPCELEALLHYNGFRVLRREGDFAGGPLEPTSEQQVLHCAAAGSRPRR